jgi:putative SOS response-associated peptidase YedK
MCSRVHQSADPFVVRNLIEKPDAVPSQELLVFRKSPSGEIVDGYLRWGLIPHHAYARPEIQPVNARAESVAEKPMFKEAYRKRRCIVPMDAFYDKKKGRLYKFCMNDRQPFGVAGIWENWRNPAGDWSGRFASSLSKQTIWSERFMTACRRLSSLRIISDGLTASTIFLRPTPRIR